MKYFTLESVRARLLTLVLLAALPVFGLVLYRSVEARQEARSRAARELASAAASLALGEELECEEAQRLLELLVVLPEVRNHDRAGCEAIFARFLAEYPEYLNLALADPKGNVIASALPLSAPVNCIDRPFFQRAMLAQNFAVGGYQIGRITGKASLDFAHPILDEAGRTTGVVVAALDLGHFAQLAGRVSGPAGAVLLCTDRDGVILARHPALPGRVGQTLSEPRLTALRGGAATLVESPDSAGIDHVYAMAPATNRSDHALYAFVGIPAGLLSAEANRGLAIDLAALGALLALVLVGTWFFAGRLLLQQAGALSVAADRLRRGDLSTRTGLAHGPDELGRLAESFDRMAEDLQRKESERGLLEDELRQSQKMEAIGRLAGGVAHDFNNLLTAILGYSDLVMKQLAAGDPLRRDMEEIRRSAERAAGLTRQLLAFSRRQPVEPKVLDLNDLVNGLGKMLKRLIGEDVDLAIGAGGGLGRVKADPGQIEQVIMNLAVNARDAMPKGGRLTIETSNVEITESFGRIHPGATPGPAVLLAVSDTGCGMDARTKTHVFEPFFTTKEKGKGTGLGLAMIYGIVKQAEGYIWFYSEPGKGTTFKIYLPRVDEAVAAPVEPAGPGPGAAFGHRGCETILLVEDEDGVRALSGEVLRLSGYTVLEARDGEEALARSAGYDSTIHLMVTDVVMPHLGGRELAEQMLVKLPELRVLFVSGYTDDVVISHGHLPPGCAFLQKPFSPDALARKVREVLDAATPTPPLERDTVRV